MKLILVAQLFLFLVFFQLTSVQVCAAEQTVKVMTWNIGGKYSLQPQERVTRLRALVDVIKTHQIDIVYLQEFFILTTDIEVLQAELNAAQYPMYLDYASYEGNKNVGALVILSKFPLDATSKKVTQIRGNRVAQSIIVRDTPIGWVRLSNLHTHNTEPCNNFRSYLNFFLQHDSARSLIGGDTNLALVHKPITRTRDGDLCVGIDWEQVNISCSDAANCLANKRPDPAIIDWFFVFKHSELYIHSSQNIGNVRGISDQHPAIVTIVGTTKPPAAEKQGDLDANNVVDIFDYNILLSVFGQTGAPGFHAADIVKNGAIDIFDYNELVKEL